MRIGYFLSETAQNLRRNFLMTIAAISTVAISLLLLGGVQILGMVVNNVTLNWEAKVEISVYLRDDIGPEERSSSTADIQSYDEVEDVTYVSKEEAFEEFRRATATSRSSRRTFPRTRCRPRSASSSPTPSSPRRSPTASKARPASTRSVSVARSSNDCYR